MFSGSWNTALSVILGPTPLLCSKRFSCTLCKYMHTSCLRWLNFILYKSFHLNKENCKILSKTNGISFKHTFSTGIPFEMLAYYKFVSSLYFFVGILTRIESQNCPSTFFHLAISCMYCKLYLFIYVLKFAFTNPHQRVYLISLWLLFLLQSFGWKWNRWPT